MQGVKKQLWDMFVSVAEQMMQDDSDIVLDYAAVHYFSDTFDMLYKNIKEEFMKNSVVYLDRHKVAAIIIIAFVRTNALGYGKQLDNSMFWGNYKLAISVGLSYMLDRLNNELREKDCKTIITKYIMPEVFMDEMPYIDVLARNIYISEIQNVSDVNVITLAEKLFMIEYITIQAYGISPNVLKHS